ncbi:MAG TPA: MFS transporter, partial [Deltaproteobacteria bacterium]|nr:MFS transporter [Deltaproteobacteria bacterium]
SVFTLARFSEAFLLLRVQGLGVRAGIVPVFYMIMNAVYALSAYPSGAISDRLGRRGVLGAGIAVLAASNLVMAVSGSPLTAALGVAMWGLHLGLTQGILASLVADTSPEDLKGSAFGLFSLASGVAMLAASLTAGLLWDLWGPQATFIAGACFSAVSLVGFAASAPRTAG